MSYPGNACSSEMQNDKPLNDVMANLALHDLKSMTVNNSSAENLMDMYRSLQTERAIVKSNDFNKQNQSGMNKIASNQWMQSPSPDLLIKPFNGKTTDGYSSSSSKEMLWASTQSSPISTQRDQLKNQFKKSTSTPSNLWESPNSKLSQSALMVKNDSSSSVWYTPPQIQSPAMSSGQSIWDSPSSSILNHSVESFSSDCASLLRPQDLSPNDSWYSANKLHQTNGFNSFKADTSVWSNTSSAVSKADSNIFTSTPYKTSSSSAHDAHKESTKKLNKSASIINHDTTPASSSCLQLFSDDFINYLNMIN